MIDFLAWGVAPARHHACRRIVHVTITLFVGALTSTQRLPYQTSHHIPHGLEKLQRQLCLDRLHAGLNVLTARLELRLETLHLLHLKKKTIHQ